MDQVLSANACRSLLSRRGQHALAGKLRGLERRPDTARLWFDPGSGNKQ